MLLAAVDDLLFSSKIRNAAKQAGVEVTFARTPQAILEQARTAHPRVVVFDLNSTATEPLATVQAIKSDPDLPAVQTVGFVSHVHTGLIEAARAVGVDLVLARSAFVLQLPEILERAR